MALSETNTPDNQHFAKCVVRGTIYKRGELHNVDGRNLCRFVVLSNDNTFTMIARDSLAAESATLRVNDTVEIAGTFKPCQAPIEVTGIILECQSLQRAI